MSTITPDMISENPKPPGTVLDEARVREIVQEELERSGLVPPVFAACYYAGY
jgi:hypothetical protein